MHVLFIQIDMYLTLPRSWCDSPSSFQHHARAITCNFGMVNPWSVCGHALGCNVWVSVILLLGDRPTKHCTFQEFTSLTRMTYCTWAKKVKNHGVCQGMNFLSKTTICTDWAYPLFKNKVWLWPDCVLQPCMPLGISGWMLVWPKSKLVLPQYSLNLGAHCTLALGWRGMRLT